MADARIYQAVAEAVTIAIPQARVYQACVEVVSRPLTGAYINPLKLAVNRVPKRWSRRRAKGPTRIIEDGPEIPKVEEETPQPSPEFPLDAPAAPAPAAALASKVYQVVAAPFDLNPDRVFVSGDLGPSSGAHFASESIWETFLRSMQDQERMNAQFEQENKQK